MRLKLYLCAFVIVAMTASAYAQETVRTMTLSNEFSGVAGTPRITRNGFKHIWAAVWRQNGAPAKIVGRTISSDGALGAPKLIASGATAFEHAFDIHYDAVNYTYLVA